MKELSIYIHIPFCDHKCIYCDFYSIIKDDARLEFIEALRKEIAYYAKLFGKNHKVTTVFFGGGTPSLMKPEEIENILEHLKTLFVFSQEPEITLETNPGTVDQSKLRDFRTAGVNRISVGVQSFDDNDLKFLTRIHNSYTAKKTILAVSNAGIDNISLDLIFNLPGQTKEKWIENLLEAIELPVKHISAYSLILERGTILNKMVLDGKVKIRDSDYDAELYESTIDFITKRGFRQYEVSNFCCEGYECKHNLAYWRYKNYLGFGPSAHSFIDNKRWWNYSALNFYLRNVKEKSNAKCNEELLTNTEMLEEYVMLTLRSNGLNITELNNKFGDGWFNANKYLLKKLLQEGYISKSADFIIFTPKGYALCDEILLKFNYNNPEIK